MEKHKDMIRKMGKAESYVSILIAGAALVLTIGLYLYFTNLGKSNPFVKKPAFSACASSQSGKTATITISQSEVTPASVMICPGQEVKWVNNDIVAHKFVVTSKGIDSARLRDIDPINPQESVTLTFDTPETVTYSLSQNSSFKGEIIVGK